MLKESAKPLPARQVEVRARAKACGVRVTVIVEGWKYISRLQSEPGMVHNIERGHDGWRCSCKGWEFTGCCRHVAAMQRRSEREGWRFGIIAPRAVTA